jgi:hypothetical protein
MEGNKMTAWGCVGYKWPVFAYFVSTDTNLKGYSKISFVDLGSGISTKESYLMYKLADVVNSNTPLVN